DPDAAASARMLDTSVLVDGRIADLVAAGALDGSLIVPRFVLRELQALADSGESGRRHRGRRGLDTLERLHRAGRLEIDEAAIPDITDVDGKLVALARARGVRLVTGDLALARVATISGVQVLNIHDLAAALRPPVVPGSTMPVRLVREGKEPGQGVGFLDDGTMVVVEGGRPRLGQGVEVIVTSVLPTAAGRIAFARLREEGREHEGGTA
ncbi:MAG TPA: TRAM domain-containing protein, partial [Candidatus Tectomicrobia bacterium]|nr:TRAM domain-containing protein [Candidatus Tectomicrobia bacterium]